LSLSPQQKIAHYLDLGQKVSDGAPGEGETGGKILPNSASMSSLEAKEDAKETNPLTDLPSSQANPSLSREPSGQKKLARNSVSNKGSAQRGSPQIIADALPLDQPGWSADYSLPTGNANEEVPQ